MPWSSIDNTLTPSQEIGAVTTTNHGDFRDFIRLMDAGLRSTISKNEAQVSEEVKVTVESNGPKLADIAPALFSPGYLQVSPAISSGVHQRIEMLITNL